MLAFRRFQGFRPSTLIPASEPESPPIQEIPHQVRNEERAIPDTGRTGCGTTRGGVPEK